jgi:hypothetical protein
MEKKEWGKEMNEKEDWGFMGCEQRRFIDTYKYF